MVIVPKSVTAEDSKVKTVFECDLDAGSCQETKVGIEIIPPVTGPIFGLHYRSLTILLNDSVYEAQERISLSAGEKKSYTTGQLEEDVYKVTAFSHEEESGKGEKIVTTVKVE